MSSLKMTFSLASLILLFAFVAMPVMAHDLVDDVADTPATHGLQHVAGTTLTDAEHSAEHQPAPTVESVELVDTMVEGESTVSGMNVQLIDDFTATPLAIAAGDSAGSFRVKITFSHDLYAEIAETAARATLDAGDFTITAAAQSAPSTNLFNATAGDGAVSIDGFTADDPATTEDESSGDTAQSKVFFATITVGPNLFGVEDTDTSDLPIDVYITVNADAGFVKSGDLDAEGDELFGTGSTASIKEMFTVVSMFDAAPGAPTEVTATADQDADTITVSWTAGVPGTEDTTGYTITQTGAAAATYNAAADATSYTTEALTAGDYSFTVVATNSVGDSDPSSPAATATINTDLPAAPVSLMATAGNAEVTLNWTDPGDATITKYQYSDDGIVWTDIDGSGATTVAHAITGLTNGTAYTYYLRAVNSAGNSDPSRANTVTPKTVPGAPTAVTATADQDANTITISWTAPADDGGAAITGYMVTKSYAGATPKTFDVSASETSLTIPPEGSTDMIDPGVEFTFTVTATNSAGTGPASAPSAAVMINVDPTEPAQPDAPTATIDPTNDLIIQISWTAPGDGGSAITGYTLMRYDSAGDAAQPISADADDTTHSIMLSDDLRGQSFTFTVTATNGVGDSMESAMSTAVMVPTLPVDPEPDPTVLAFSSAIEDQMFQVGMVVDLELPTATGGQSPYTYSLHKGRGKAPITADNGLTLNQEDLSLEGTPMEATAAGESTTYTWRVTDSSIPANVVDEEFAVTVSPEDVITPTNVAPVVAITTTAPTTAQMGSFAIAYTATDANGDVPSVNVTHTVSPPSATGYTVTHNAATKMVTITQAADSPIAVIEVTITATDIGGLTHSGTIDVTFSESAPVPVDTTPPTVDITVAPAPAGPNVHADTLRITLNFNEPIQPDTIDIGRAATDVPVLQISDPMVNATDNTIYTVDVLSEGYRTRAKTDVLLKRGVKDLAGNATTSDVVGTYMSPVIPVPTVAITAHPDPINCDTGSTISFAITGSDEKLAAGDITVSAGWVVGTDNDPSNGNITIVPDGDNAIGITTVTVTVAANAVGSNAATPATFTVGPVLTIPGNSYILVNHPAHEMTTHLRDPLILGSLPIRAPEVVIQTWECMPDLTIFFGRSAPAIGGGAIVVKEADGPMGHDPDNTKGDIGKGSVGVSEIMWASDEGIQHGGAYDVNTGRRSRTNYDQTREQWIELHNRNSAAVKVTLFARPTNTALTIEADELDRASNYSINNVWVPKGNSGNSETGVDFVSMQRGKSKDGGVNVADAGAPPPAGSGYAHGEWNGSDKGAWSVSTFSYLTARAGLWQTLPAENQNYDFFGSPGRSNKFTVSTPLHRSNVPKNSIVFNEIANRRDQTLEWIELKNVSDALVNLKKYQISLATATGTDVAFYTFPDNDNIKLAAGEILLLLDTDPRDNDDHPIEVAFNRDGGNDQGLGIGDDAIKYKVANFREGGLPDDGNFVLYLRNRNDRLKSHEGIIDLIGWSDKLADASKHTSVWPLNIFGAPDTRNSIAVETVHRRQHRIDPDKNTHGDDKDEHQALRDVGYTGVGYKRHAQRIAAHGGTPGHEDTRKNLVADVTTGVLTISEIMFDQGDGSYPQWIEIYNSSPTQPVNLHSEAGWRLVIENFDDGEIPIDALSGTLNFKNSEVQTILPQQTVLVTSTRARNSGSAFFDTRVIFPATRVFSVWDDQRGELGMTRSRQPILSNRGFYIELIDGKGNFSDGVGNLVKSPNRRVAATIEWEFSDVTGDMADMPRSSILRRYNEYKNGREVGPYSAAEIEDMGVTAEGWRAAYKTDFLNVRDTWYGHPDDSGSPGITGGRVLPVSLSKFRPERLDDGSIVVRWVTESELNNAGFNILRSETRDGEFTQINTSLIAGKGTTSEQSLYEWKDTSAKPNVVYYYQIQDVSLDGKVTTLRQSRLKGNVSPAGKATTTWGEIKALQ